MERNERGEDLMQRRARGELTPLEALLLAKATRVVPESPELLQRVAALARPLEALHARRGGAGAALEVLRAAQGSELAQLDRDEVVRALAGDWASVSASEVTEAATLSLKPLGERAKLGAIEQALARWVEQRLPEASAREALELFARCEGAQAWWREAVQRGVDQASQARSVAWAQAVWRWWGQEPHEAQRILRPIERSAANEGWLLGHVPLELDVRQLLPAIAECKERRWPHLAARLLCAHRELAPRIKGLRQFGRSCSPRAVEAVLEGVDPRAVIVEAQHSCDWPPLIWAAARRTRRDPALLAAVENPRGAAWLAVAHERDEGAPSVDEHVPEKLRVSRDYREAREKASEALQLTVLLLGASPKGAPPVDYGAEAREIEQRVRNARYRDLVKVEYGLAVRRGDLQELLLKHEPHIVHFAGHAGEHALLLESDDGKKAPVTGSAFAKLMQQCCDWVQVVVLNGCCTSKQTEKIARDVGFAIGMNDEITQTPAREFAAAFYGALASGKSLRDSFELGKNQLDVLGLVNAVDVPALYPEKGGEEDFML